LFKGVVIGLVIALLAAWALGILPVKAKYGSKAEYDAAVRAGKEMPQEVRDAMPDPGGPEWP
jgi:hypothetical protein